MMAECSFWFLKSLHCKTVNKLYGCRHWYLEGGHQTWPGRDTEDKSFFHVDNIKMNVRKLEFDIMSRFELSQDMVIWRDFPLVVINLRATLQYRISQTKSNSLLTG